MKYLKKFKNSFISENKYYELSNSDDNKGRISCKIDDDVINALNTTLGSSGRMYHPMYRQGTDRPAMYRNYKSSSLSGAVNIIVVLAYEDDWYKVYTSIVGSSPDYYWCDQLEGLIKCVEDKFIKYAT